MMLSKSRSKRIPIFNEISLHSNLSENSLLCSEFTLARKHFFSFQRRQFSSLNFNCNYRKLFFIYLCTGKCSLLLCFIVFSCSFGFIITFFLSESLEKIYAIKLKQRNIYCIFKYVLRNGKKHT